MKVISIQEPYASYIANGYKVIETRSTWKYKYLGGIYIHASSTLYDVTSEKTLELLRDLKGDIHPSCIVAKAKLVKIEPITEELIQYLKENNPTEFKSGFYEVGRMALYFEDVEKIEPIPVKGHLGIWEYKGD